MTLKLCARLIVGFAVAALATPGHAQSYVHSGSEVSQQKNGAFAGLAFNMALDSPKKVRPVAPFQIGMTRTSYDTGSGLAPRTTLQEPALAFGFTGGKPEFLVAGQNTKMLARRAQINGGKTWMYVAGGLVVAAGAAFYLIVTSGHEDEPCIPGNC